MRLTLSRPKRPASPKSLTTTTTTTMMNSSSGRQRSRTLSDSAISSGRQRSRTLSDGSTHSILGAPSMKQRIRQEEERLSKNRKTVNGYLKRITALTGENQLKLDKTTGMVYFPYRRFIIVLEVPADHPGLLYIYTCVCRLEKGDNRMRVMEKALEMNFMQHGTRGATLGLLGDEVDLCFSTPIAGLQADGLKVVLEDFFQTALESNQQLVRAKSSR